MLAFFATIGLNANLLSLKAGGKTLLIFIFVVVGLLLVQNTVGIALSKLLGLDPLMGLLACSITLSGGHGTGGAWGKIFTEYYGFQSATEVAMACATFGLVFGGLIGGPIARFLLIIQAIVMGFYAIFVTFPVMGKNYDAAVLAAGHCGFGLGATPTAIANMQAVTERFGPSHLAFLVVPMVGAFFIDIINALVIKFYLWLPIFSTPIMNG